MFFAKQFTRAADLQIVRCQRKACTEIFQRGNRFIASEIVIVGIDGNNRQQLSTTSSEIKMFPSVNADGTKVAYHSTEGKIYLMTIKEK